MYIVKHLRNCTYVSNDDTWTASQRDAKRFVSRDEALAQCSNTRDDGHRVLKLVPKVLAVADQKNSVASAAADKKNSVPDPIKGFVFEVYDGKDWQHARIAAADAFGTGWVRADGTRRGVDAVGWCNMWKRGDARLAKTTHWSVTRVSEYDPASALDNIPLRCPEVERLCAKEWMRTAAQHLRNEEYLAEDRDAWKERAEKLWNLLDHIDTQDDACREFDNAFRARARKHVKRRFEILVSDGYTLSVPEQKAVT